MVEKKLEVSAKLFCRTIQILVYNPDLIQERDNKLTSTQLACLYFVCVHNEPSVGDIANGLTISNAAAAKLIDRLVKKRYLVRTGVPEDRRVLKIKLTPAGINILERYSFEQTKVFSDIIRQMPPESRGALEYALLEFLKAALVTPELIEKVCLRCGWEHFPDCPGNQKYKELTGADKSSV